MEKQELFKPLYALNHTPINAHFSKNSTDFVVRENPLYEFSGDGEHLILHIQKKDLTTPEALKILSEISGCRIREFGYAGLKDKEGMTVQYISLPRKFESNLANFSHEKLKILDSTYHNNKIRIGHLKGNNFFIRLKKVMPSDALKLENAIKKIDEIGFANYFGYQRFGKFGDNAKSGLEILKGEKKLKNPKMRDFLISAYQSELFNRWLSKRVEISKFSNEFEGLEIAQIYGFSKDEVKNLKSQKSFFKLLDGDVLGHYPFGKFFLCEDLKSECERFEKRDITSCGLIVGKRAYQSAGLARKFEDEIYQNSYEFENLMEGSRRFAWCYLKDVSFKYTPETAQFSFSFSLDKGSYATVVLEEILHRDIFEQE
ncbi:tRNA pseudouridine(13) synthase TruD [Campylobacter geochelonis]|uniref:tRNA pseudouridine synthase D n=1 Tax=Campylobacter geochelonis TaxID=1780362 RepID=A0A128EIA4_9BACT|nr:tRNA pseudouridine(13) synthase TruD [Campylobacter geochelonis]QKF71442.1 tRNA pseudouridine 13 synthase [Campylobacter geochelonis]CZE47843.1 tRNA pseudouridine synthase D [Campylobacter geochelonis]CZE48337.1 tRNA pseudouridine synthase D [Campylobacter geochelonis]